MFQEVFKRLSIGTQLMFVIFIGIITQNFAAYAMLNLPSTTEWILMRLLISNTLLFLLPPMLLLKWRGENPAETWKLVPEKNARLWMAALLIPLLLPVGDWIATQFHQIQDVPDWYNELRTYQDSSEDLIDGIFSGSFVSGVLGFLAVCVLAPLGEEFFFRGMLQRLLYQSVSAWLAVLIPATLFAIVHLQIDNLVPIFMLALAMGWIYHRTRQLWITIVGHFTFNFITYMIEAGWISEFTSATFIGITAVAALVIFFMVPKKVQEPLPQPPKPTEDRPE